MEITAKEALCPNNKISSLTLPDLFSFFKKFLCLLDFVLQQDQWGGLTLCEWHSQKKIELTSTVIIVIVLGAKVSEEQNQWHW